MRVINMALFRPELIICWIVIVFRFLCDLLVISGRIITATKPTFLTSSQLFESEFEGKQTFVSVNF